MILAPVRLACLAVLDYGLTRGGEQLCCRGHSLPHWILDLCGVIRYVEHDGHGLALRCYERNVVIVSQAHSHGFVPPVHQAVSPPDLQHPFVRKCRPLRQSPRGFEPARIPKLSPAPNGILDACRAVGVNLGGTGAEIGFLIECGRELLAVLQQ